MDKILTIPKDNAFLREKSKPVEINQKTKDLIAELKKTIISESGLVGIGLSSPQIGFHDRVFIVYSKESRKLLVFINPEITWCSKRLTNGIPDSKNKLEGCLSVPKTWGMVKRFSIIKIRYQSENNFWQIRKFSGLTATIIQHEYDHLDGILFIDRVLEQKGQLYHLEKDENEKEVLKEIEINV